MRKEPTKPTKPKKPKKPKKPTKPTKPKKPKKPKKSYYTPVPAHLKKKCGPKGPHKGGRPLETSVKLADLKFDPLDTPYVRYLKTLGKKYYIK